MAKGRYDDEIWDEHQWESYLDEIERRSEQLRKFIASDKDLPRWLSLLEENPDIVDAVEAFIEEEMQIEDAYLAEDDDEDADDWEWEDDELDEAGWEDELDEEDSFFDEIWDDEDFDDGEEWKELSEDFALSENGSLENLDIYIRARDFSVNILKWADSVHPKFHSDAFSNFISTTLKIGAKLAGGYSFGFERDYMGANIACTKKALYAANKGLHILEDHLKGSIILSQDEYRYLHEQLYELRNDIGIYVQELREQFYLGFE